MIDLYVKPGCPWCTKATNWLDSAGFTYTLRNVTADAEAASEMKKLTGKSLAPSMRVRQEGEDDLILADFGPSELEKFVQKHELKPSSV